MNRYFKSEGAQELALQVYISILGAFAFQVIYSTLRARDYYTSTFLLCFILAIGFLAGKEFKKVVQVRRKGLRPSTNYYPFDSDKVDPWPRRPELKALLEMTDAENKLIIVTGPSGAGKSMLLSRLFVSELKDRHIYSKYIRKYDGKLDFDSENLPDERVIILDQFEHLCLQIVQSGNSVEDIRKDREAVVATLTSLIKRDRIVVIGISEDKYYHLRFLGDLLPSLSKAVAVGRIDSQNHPDLYETFTKSIRVNLGRVVKFAERCTMLELQAYGAFIEQYKGPQDVLSEISPFSALKELVDLYLDESPNKSMTARVLYALKQSRSSLFQHQLTTIIDDKEKDIQEACDYLVDLQIVRRVANRYEVAHDALEGPIDICTTERLRPNERDTIQYSIRMLHENGDAMDQATKPPRTIGVAHVFMYILAFAVIPRLFIKWHGWYAFSNISPSIAGQGLVDALYLGIAVPHLLWCYYIAWHDIKIFRLRDKTKAQRYLSYLVLLSMAICILIAMFLPEFWIAAIAAGGVFYAIKLFGLSFSHGLNHVARSAYRSRAYRTFFNMFVHLFIGVVFGLLVWSHVLSDSDFLMVTYFVSFLFTTEWIIMFDLHLSNEQAAYYRGLLRPKYTGATALRQKPESSSDASPAESPSSA